MTLLSQVFCFFGFLHRYLYVKGLFKKIKLQKTVISVGNLTFGGTGKTPLVKKLVTDLKSLGFRPAVVVKSYKGLTKKSALLDQEKSLYPNIWGDEACWYATQLDVPIYSGPQKWKSAILADQNQQVDVLILDDGFQHHRLHRDLDIVLIDAAAGIKSLKTRAREWISSLQFADLLILSRANLVAPEVLEEFQNKILFNKPQFLNLTVVEKVRDLNGCEINLKGSRAGLVSGLANPDSFYNLFKINFSDFEIFKLEFEDHHDYSEKDLKKIEKFRFDNKLDLIVTTEKDEVKLKQIIKNNEILRSFPFAVLQIKSEFENQENWLIYLKGFFQ